MLESTLLITGVSNLPGIMQLHHHWSSHTKHAQPTMIVQSRTMISAKQPTATKMQSMMTQAICNSACQASGHLLCRASPQGRLVDIQGYQIWKTVEASSELRL